MAIIPTIINQNTAGTSFLWILRNAVLRAAGELKRRDLLPVVRDHLSDPNLDCKFWAAWSAGLLAKSKPLELLQRFVESRSKYQFQLLFRLPDGTGAGAFLPFTSMIAHCRYRLAPIAHQTCSGLDPHLLNQFLSIRGLSIKGLVLSKNLC